MKMKMVKLSVLIALISSGANVYAQNSDIQNGVLTLEPDVNVCTSLPRGCSGQIV